MRFSCAQRKGFTLVELLVALAILALLVAIVLANMNEAKKKARDMQRISDLQQIAVGARMYRDFFSTSTLPSVPSGEIFGDGAGFDTVLTPYLPATIKDPINSGTTRYYYNSVYTCNSSTSTVVIALTMERSGNGNMASVCGAGPYGAVASGATPTASSYVIILK